MITRSQPILFCVITSAATLGTWLVADSSARADLSTCGGIFLSGDAACDYRPKEECMTECMTVAVEQSCVSEVYNECETSCTTTATTECENTCTTSCVDQCTTTVMSETGPTCKDLCLADCEAEGDRGACNSSSRRSACGRCAKFNCEKKCEAKCGDDPQPVKVTSMTECMPTCTNACSASCTAKVNTECQVDCQERTYTQCEQKMVEQCETQCEDKGGAIFCDGQFVNAANAESCADELRAEIDIDIDIDATLDEAGDDAEEAVEDVGDEIDDACSVTHVGAAGTRGALFALPLLGFALWRMTRRRAR